MLKRWGMQPEGRRSKIGATCAASRFAWRFVGRPSRFRAGPETGLWEVLEKVLSCFVGRLTFFREQVWEIMGGLPA